MSWVLAAVLAEGLPDRLHGQHTGLFQRDIPNGFILTGEVKLLFFLALVFGHGGNYIGWLFQIKLPPPLQSSNPDIRAITFQSSRLSLVLPKKNPTAQGIRESPLAHVQRAFYLQTIEGVTSPNFLRHASPLCRHQLVVLHNYLCP